MVYIYLVKIQLPWHGINIIPTDTAQNVLILLIAFTLLTCGNVLIPRVIRFCCVRFKKLAQHLEDKYLINDKLRISTHPIVYDITEHNGLILLINLLKIEFGTYL